MTWPLLALLTAFFRSLTDIFGKKGVQRADLLVVSWSLRAFTLPLLLPGLFFIDIPALSATYWWAVAGGGTLNIITTILYMYAIRDADLSLTVPMVSFSPLFLLGTAPLILGEFPDSGGLTGVLLIIAGSYILNLDTNNKEVLAPFKALFRSKGPRLMLLIALIWSFTATIDKIGIQHSTPFLWVLGVNVFVTIFMFPLLWFRSRQHLGQLKIHAGVLFPMGAVTALSLLLQMMAMSMTLVVHVIAIKRMSTVFSVFWGHWLFGEEKPRERATGAFIMVAGVALILLA